MLDREQLEKSIKLFSQNAWRVEQNTTVNSMIEYICRETANLLLNEFNDELDEIKYQLAKLKGEDSPINDLSADTARYTINNTKEYKSNGEDGGHENAKRNTKTQDEKPSNGASKPRR